MLSLSHSVDGNGLIAAHRLRPLINQLESHQQYGSESATPAVLFGKPCSNRVLSEDCCNAPRMQRQRNGFRAHNVTLERFFQDLRGKQVVFTQIPADFQFCEKKSITFRLIL